jgi:hypothetical protein
VSRETHRRSKTSDPNPALPTTFNDRLPPGLVRS